VAGSEVAVELGRFGETEGVTSRREEGVIAWWVGKNHASLESAENGRGNGRGGKVFDIR